MLIVAVSLYYTMSMGRGLLRNEIECYYFVLSCGPEQRQICYSCTDTFSLFFGALKPMSKQ